MKLSHFDNEVCSIEYAKIFEKYLLFNDSPFKWVEEKENNFIFFNESEDLPENISKEIAFPTPTISMLFEKLPNRINLFESNTPVSEGLTNDSFRLRIEKCILLKENELKIHYLSNYHSENLSFSGEDAWIKKTLLPHNIFDIKLADCLAKLIIDLLNNKFLIIRKGDILSWDSE